MSLNLFSSFDPSTSNYFRLNWLRLIIPLILIPIKFWIINSRIRFIPNKILSYIVKELKNNFQNNKLANLLFFIRIFWFILINNLLGLFPYIFTATGHLTVRLSIALSLWLIFYLYGWISNFNKIFAHLVPLRTPIYLARFIVLIETIRTLIRPITLSIRLRANIIAGHLLLTLLSSIREKLIYIYIFIIPILIILLALELAVSIIQRYVFTTLVSLYFNEV